MADTFYTSNGKVISSSVNFGRKYRVLIYSHASGTSSSSTTTNAEAQAGDTVLDVSDLRCTFEISRYALYYPNKALIEIYNLNASTENTIVQEGYRVVVEAGYESNYGQIFDGTVLMCNREKQDGTDYILRILALDGTQFINEGYCSFTYEKGQTARAVIENIASKATNAVSLGYASPVFDTITYSKGVVVHGLAKNTLSDIAKTANGTWFVDSGKLYVVSYSDDSSTLPLGEQAVELSEKTGLVGNPTQVDQGVSAKCLLNPKLMPYGLVHISNDLITQQLVSIGSYSDGVSTPYMLDSAGIYRIVSVTFKGDTRGNEWYSEISTVTQSGNIPELLQGISGTIN